MTYIGADTDLPFSGSYRRERSQPAVQYQRKTCTLMKIAPDVLVIS
jgi:hypothetical protein